VHDAATEVEGLGEAAVVGGTLPGGVGAADAVGAAAVGKGEGRALAGDGLELAGGRGAVTGGAVVGPAIRISSTLEEAATLRAGKHV
jgi:hypothetical protein